MQTIACIKGKFGTTEYYQTKIRAGDLITIVGFASEMPEWDEMTADDILQREIDVNRVIADMVPYVVDDPDRFFSSLVIDIYQGWEDIEFELLENITGKLPNAYKNAMENFGFVTFPGNQVLIALDGQHRLLSLKIAIKGKMGVPAGVEWKPSWDKKVTPHPEIANEEVSVIFVKHESNAKIRKLFNKINKYAKQTSRSENIIISEDDIFAVIARRLISEKGPLNALQRGEYTQDIVNWKSNTLGQRSAHLTTLSSIYTISQTLLKEYSFNTNYLPEEDIVDLCYETVEAFWVGLLENVKVYNEYMKKILDFNIAAEYRQRNLLFKPVTQMALAHVAYYASKRNVEFNSIALLLNKIDWSFENKLWQNILVIGSAKKKMITGKDAIRNAGLIITYITMGNIMTSDEKEDVLEIIRNAEDNIDAELPIIVS
ncbi:MAG: DNA sulfur modification protein DndB [Lachnospiraceae bacterium]